MKYLFILIIFAGFISCKEDKPTPIEKTTSISNDSIAKIIHSKWNFKSPKYSDDVYYVLNNWNEWRTMINHLENKPAGNITDYLKKTSDLVTMINSLPNSVPENFNNPAVISRINLLLTHAQNLEMLLELNPVPHKEVTPLLNHIQKDISSISNQFQEIITKNKIPKEVGEDAVRVSVDTVKRATLNAIPTE